MNQNEPSITTSLFDPLFEIVPLQYFFLSGILGSIGRVLLILWTLSAVVPNDINHFIRNTLILLVIIGEIGLSKRLNRKTNILIGLFIILFVYYTVNLFARSVIRELTGSFDLVRPILLAIPALLLFALYWNLNSYSKGLVIIRPIFLFVNFLTGFLWDIIWELDLFEQLGDIAFALGDIGQYILILFYGLLSIWFFSLLSSADSIIAPTSARSITPVSYSSSEATQVPSYQPHGDLAVRGPPIMLFWCDKCGKQIKKGIKLKSFKPEEIQREKHCPTCNSPVKQWWAESTMNDYLQGVMGMSLIIGALITGLVTANFFQMGVIPLTIGLILVIIQTIVGFVWSRQKRNQSTTVQRPPSHASVTAPIEPGKMFASEAIKLAISIGVLGFIIFGINMTIIGILTEVIA